MARTSRRARRNSPLNLPSAFELFSPSKDLVLKNIWIFGPLYAITLIFGIHDWISSPSNGGYLSQHNTFSLSMPGNPLPGFDFSAVVGFSKIWISFVIILGTAISVMSLSAQLRAVEGKPLDFLDLFKDLKKYWLRLFGLYLLFSLLVIALTWMFFFGLLLFVIGALVALTIFFVVISRYILAPYALIDENLSISQSLRRSAELTANHRSSIWGVVGVMILISLIDQVPRIGGIMSFIVGCLYSLALAFRYQQLKKITI